MFENDRPRYASYGIVNSLPGEIIDQIWYIIDHNLQGMFQLNEIISFNLTNHNHHLTFDFLQQDHVVASFDTPFPYAEDFPKTLWVYDDGSSQIVLLPKEEM
ncbi:DUF960 domain-containing protein [Secundilactobacillus silagei]|uniref:GTP cyclohydrolase n=1 Tax=Secundilactobacillus silagei JCM 19001 TaxID=1302250 RepID=A0A1Z5II05_9LACO|nr:DUF960 domain-containing protein [Secundilactobacillus silagei]TDG67461.1 hypothetical protein C5L25_001057 [Secundilactobacillus silagei JCM 19001]GAX01404.1 hypothetical protein IWT126_01432 [Secundilactobacillus silagei JCM 19001]